MVVKEGTSLNEKSTDHKWPRTLVLYQGVHNIPKVILPLYEYTWETVKRKENPNEILVLL